MFALKPAKVIVIFCTSLEIGGEPISSEYYWEAYQDMLLALKARGVEAYFATDNEAYRGGGKFSVAYTTDRKVADPAHMQAVYGVTADLVFERAESRPFAGTDVTVLNPEALRRIANNKIAIYRQFARLQPKSVVVNSPDELLAAMTDLGGDLIVVKDQEGYGGDGVYIGRKSKVLEQVAHRRYPMLVQEFLDTSIGVPGYGPGVHDVRIEICGGRVTGFYIRKATHGSYHSNVNRGGRKIFLTPDDVPAELKKSVDEIDKVFAGYPRFYSADFAFSPQGWKLIELNDYVGLARWQPGISEGNRYESDKNFDRLADYLVDSCKRASRIQPELTTPARRYGW
jgi:glutathione synthase/RimK-type ligase-like ATP-grasp enzyme